MAGNPACTRYVPLLSPYIDGELAPAERVTVERHLAACRDCTGRTADLRAESGLVRVGLEMAADEVDFKDFAQKVMARVTPERPPLLERVRLSFSEMLRYQRTAFLSSLATAAVVLLVAIPLLTRDSAPVGYAGERMTVQAVHPHGTARVAPVVMEAEDGNAIIWLVDEQKVKAGGSGEASEESQSDELEMDGELPALQPRTKPKPQQEGEL
ncbi:MAG TPA: zf-HC2 domain-containing protein [Aggregicoccus sp.]|nr:zf-HC2 domain-containing protein [Aggregicoccus sp.]